MKLKKSILSLLEAGVEDDEIVMIYNANDDIVMTIKNADDLSSKTKVRNVVLQGDTLAPLMAAVYMDSVAKGWLEKAGDEVYMYKDKFKVGSLGVIDDLLMISKAGIE